MDNKYLDSKGALWMFPAPTEGDRQRILLLIDRLRHHGPPGWEELAEELEQQHGELFRALAAWVRDHQDALITSLIPTIVTVLLHAMNGQGISAEDLERILREKDGSPTEIVIVEQQDDEAPNEVGAPDDPAPKDPR